MIRIVWIGFLVIATICSNGCSTSDRDTPNPARVAKARATIEALEQRLEGLKALPPRERRQAYLALEGDLEQAVEDTDNLPQVNKSLSADEKSGATFASSGIGVVTYSYHSKALFWLANWRVLYANGRGAEELLNQLDRQMSQTMKLSSPILRVQLYLRLGRVVDARNLAEDLVIKRQMNELSGLLDQVAWFEQVGRPAPRVPDRNLAGGLADPLAGESPFILMVFTQSEDQECTFYMERLRETLASLPVAKRPRLVHVTFEGSPLRAAQMITPGEDLMWANPNTDGSAVRWKAAWKVPDPLPRNVLIGPDRSVLAVEMTPEQLAELKR